MTAAHAELGASSYYRWAACPGSIRMSRGLPDTPSEYAQIGTAAHEVHARCLLQGSDPIDYVGAVMEGVEIDADMAERITVSVDAARAATEDADEKFVEVRFSLDKLNPPGPMFGTSDYAAYWAERQHLLVWDYKDGAGVAVEAVNNKQLLFYGLGAALALDKPVSTVELVIAQPRAGGIKRWEIDSLDLMDAAGELLDAANRAMAPDAPLAAGDHCKFCKARALCPELRQFAFARAKGVFDELEEPVPEDADDLVPPATLTDAELAELVGYTDAIKTWLDATLAEAQRRLELGRELPGWKLVQKRAVRKWASEGQAAGWLQAHGVDPEMLFRKTLVTPAQAEKLLPKQLRSDLSGLVAAVSSGVTMARAADPRPAVPSVITDLD